MADSLPLEVLSLIAAFAAYPACVSSPLVLDEWYNSPPPLVAFALVNKAWQLAFERQIWADISVLSPSTSRDVTVHDYDTETRQSHPKHGLPLDTLDTLTRGPQAWRQARRSALHRIRYKVAVPHWLADQCWQDVHFLRREDIHKRENDAAFDFGITRLFTCLSEWQGRPNKLSLHIMLQGEDIYDLKHVGPLEDVPPVAEEIWPYMASLPEGLHLPAVNGVVSLTFSHVTAPSWMGTENHVNPSTALAIASACTTLQQLNFSGPCANSHTEPTYVLEARDATARKLLNLPDTLRILKLRWNVIPDDIVVEIFGSGVPSTLSFHPDALSTALHRIAQSLRILDLSCLEIQPSLFWPDSTDQTASKPYWPNLEILYAKEIPYHTFDDQNLRSTTPWHSAEAARGPKGESMWPQDPGDSVNFNYFDKLYESLGCAARRMPKVEQIRISFVDNGDQLSFTVEDHRRIFEYRSEHGYSPTKSLLKLWGVNEAHLVSEWDKWLSWVVAECTEW